MNRAFIWIFIICIFASALLDVLRHAEHGHGILSSLYFPGFYAVLGFVGSVIIILVSKFIGHNWLQKKEDFYEGNDDD
ncbi:hypothetical protein ACFLTW_04200 [Chloroflexota bacterium]